MTGFSKGVVTAFAVSLFATTALALPTETFVDGPAGRIITPGSSQKTTGQMAHTNLHILVPGGRVLQPATSPSGIYETPASLACLYKQVRRVRGCNPETLTAVAQGGSKVVVIVDAYDDPTATADLTKFSKQFGLPVISAQNFQVVYAAGTKPTQDSTGGWELEESLDIEMAHSLAPNAKIILVEANSATFDDLFAAETVAAGLAANAGGGEVSNSWAGPEVPDTPALEAVFTGANVVFFASAGDIPGVELPSSFSNVVGVGGTTINRDSNGDFLRQTIWPSTGGGYSLEVPIPPYQYAIASLTHNVRGVPDVALDADPNSGVWIYDSTPYLGTALDWVVVGGTSVASPSVAAIVNSAQSFAASSVVELTTIYSELGNDAYFTDIKNGLCANGTHLHGWKGWDPCTGVGTPYGRKGK
jgi:kumamolisin